MISEFLGEKTKRKQNNQWRENEAKCKKFSTMDGGILSQENPP
jgi:hypothetical protein